MRDVTRCTMLPCVAFAGLASTMLLLAAASAAWAQSNNQRIDPVRAAINQARPVPGGAALPVPAPAAVAPATTPGQRSIQWNDQFGGAPSSVSNAAIAAARATPQTFDLGNGMQVVPGIGGVRIVGPDGPNSAGLRIGSTASGSGVAVGIGIPTTLFGQ